MSIVTGYRHSSDFDPPLPCDDYRIEELVQKILDKLGRCDLDVVNIQLDGPFGAGEWGVRVFCRKS